MSNGIENALPILFPIAFAALWLAVTTLLGFMSGWFALQRVYPCGDDPPLLTLRMRSGSMGIGVAMNHILTLSACRSGLRVGMLRLFGPFERPFLVPWNEIGVEPSNLFFLPRVRLRFGRPEVGSLRIDARTWQRLAAAVPGAPAASTMPVSRVAEARGFLLQWLGITIFAGSFFYIASRASLQQQGVPAVICYGFPAIVFGAALALRFVMQER